MEELMQDEVARSSSVSRRRVLKTAAGASVAAAVWAEPTIRGLAHRPAYAAGASGPIMTSFSGSSSFGPSGPTSPTTLQTQTVNGAAVSLGLSGAGSSWTMSASAAGCVCEITDGLGVVSAAVIFFIFELAQVEVDGVLSGGVITFNIAPAGPFPRTITDIAWDVMVTCV